MPGPLRLIASLNVLSALLCRLRSEAYEGRYHHLPFLVTDLAAQPEGYATAEPCMDSFLYQIEHINETVIALPPAMAVSK